VEGTGAGGKPILTYHEGLNDKSSEIRYGCSNFEFASRISKYDKGIIGVKSYCIMLIEPPYTRPAWFTQSEVERTTVV
jgi:hypothetical protein